MQTDLLMPGWGGTHPCWRMLHWRFRCSQAVFCPQVLVEDHQVRPDGTVRRRGVLLSEKLQHGEAWQAAVPRAVREELGTALQPEAEITFDPASCRWVMR